MNVLNSLHLRNPLVGKYLHCEAFVAPSLKKLFMRPGFPSRFGKCGPSRIGRGGPPQRREPWRHSYTEMAWRERHNRPPQPPIYPGDIVRGRVIALQPYGAFLDIGHYRTGLVHLSEISNEFVRDISKFLKVGDEVDVKVLGVDNHRISLSLKAMKPRTNVYPPDVEARYDRLLSLGGDWGHPWNDDGKTKWADFGEEEKDDEHEDDAESCTRLPDNIGKTDIPWSPGVKHSSISVNVLPQRGSRRLGKPLTPSNGTSETEEKTASISAAEPTRQEISKKEREYEKERQGDS